jgi:hypothetical protein
MKNFSQQLTQKMMLSYTSGGGGGVHLAHAPPPKIGKNMIF